MMNFNVFQLGTSIAFSWGSAASLLFGMQIMQQRGLTAFLLWAIPNALCMSVFGYLYHKGWLKLFPQILPSIYNKLIKVVMIVFQIVFLLFQLRLLQGYFFDLTQNLQYSYIISSLITALFVLIVYHKGLQRSISTDVWQGWITIVSIFAFVCYCLLTSVPTHVIPVSTESDIMWGLWASSAYIFAIIVDLQHWRRADIDSTGKAFYAASAIFGLHLLGVALLSQFVLPSTIQLLLIIPVLGLATSTIDSIAVAMHECFNKQVGTGVCLFLCAFWWVINEGSFFIWNSMGAIRLIGAALIIIGSIYYFVKLRQQQNNSLQSV